MSAKNALKITTKLFKINLFRGVKVSKSLKLTSILEDCRKLFNLLKFNISNKQITMADEFFYGKKSEAIKINKVNTLFHFLNKNNYLHAVLVK